jgi:hypothetical protein
MSNNSVFRYKTVDEVVSFLSNTKHDKLQLHDLYQFEKLNADTTSAWTSEELVTIRAAWEKRTTRQTRNRWVNTLACVVGTVAVSTTSVLLWSWLRRRN